MVNTWPSNDSRSQPACLGFAYRFFFVLPEQMMLRLGQQLLLFNDRITKYNG